MSGSLVDDLLEDLISDSDDDLPTGWEMRVTDEGRVFYVDHNTRMTQWKHPKTEKEKMLSADLPFGWKRGTDVDGSMIFIDQVNKRSTCIDPRIAYAMNRKKKAMMKFDASSSAMAVLRGRDMRGKTALITGGNSGIGFETAKALSLHGCHVVILCRDMKKGIAAVNKIKSEQTLPVDIDLVHCDLASFTSVEECAAEILKREWNISILICNAAVLGPPYITTEAGIELTFATNHLGHFYLTDLLKDKLIKSSPSRVVVVSSESHRYPMLHNECFSIDHVAIKKENYWPVVAYNQSKLCNLLFAFELNRRMSPYGVYCNAVHPGNYIPSNIARNSNLLKFVHLMTRPFSKSTSQAAATTVYCATSEELEGVGGYYFNNCCACKPHTQAEDEQLAKRLWEYSDKLVKRQIDAFGHIQGLRQI